MRTLELLSYFFLFSFITCYSMASTEQTPETTFLQPFAKECSSVTILSQYSNVRWDILEGLSESPSALRKYLQIDIECPPSTQLNFAQELAEKNKIDFTFWRIHAKHIEMESTDMLVIDSAYDDLKTFVHKARKYICVLYPNDSGSNQDELNAEWILIENDSHHAIFKRLDETTVPDASYDAEVENYLRHKIILCTGPALGNYDLLKKTTEADMRVIPFKKIFVTTNDPAIMNITFNDKVPVRQLIPNQGKQLDCLNCIFTTLKNAVNDPEIADDDIIIFKHETVHINDMNLIKKALRKILNGYDMVARSWMVPKSRTRGTDVFFVRVWAIREIVKDFPLVMSFTPQATFCEEYFTDYIVNLLSKVYDVPYHHSNGGFTELGFYHIPSWAEAHKPYWDRRNYDQLFSKD